MNAPADESRLESFLARLEIQPQDLRLYREAFTHRSLLNESKHGILSSNERLEFLGDAVLGFLACDFLFRRHPQMKEGSLAKAKSALVSEEALARWAKELGLGALLDLGKGEEKSGGREKDALLADCFEALLAALYLDLGVERAAVFLESFLQKKGGAGANHDGSDSKTRLQEWSQRFYKEPPRYTVTKTTGPEHARRFEVEVSVRERVLASGKGKNKKEAEQSAAAFALEQLEK